MFSENLIIFLRLIIILDTIEEIWVFLINFQKFLWVSKTFWINIKKKSNCEKIKILRNLKVT